MRRWPVVSTTLMLVSTRLFAAEISWGLRAGASSFVVGPFGEVRIRRTIALSGDFLLRRMGLETSPNAPRLRVWTWEAPVSGTYRAAMPGRPFFRAGVSVNRVFRVTGAVLCARGPYGETLYCTDGKPMIELRHRSVSGLFAGGGLQVGRGRLQLEPEIRWTRWLHRNIGVRDSAIRSYLNQLDVFVGLRF